MLCYVRISLNLFFIYSFTYSSINGHKVMSSVSSFLCVREKTCKMESEVGRRARPIFRYFTPLGPRKFCPPPPLFVRIQLSVSKNNTKN